MSLTKEALEIHEDWTRRGAALLESNHDSGGVKEYFSVQNDLDIVERDHGLAERRHRMLSTAIMLDNAKRWLKNMDEAVRAVDVGGYLDYILPVIRAGFPNQVAHDLVSVQPLTRPTAQVFYMNYIVGQEKGSFSKGQRILDARTGFSGQRTYTSEEIDTENQGTSAASATQSGNLSYIPIRRGTVTITIEEAPDIVLVDDNNAGLVLQSGPGGPIVSSSINYETGAWTVVMTVARAGGDAVVASYEYDSEMAPSHPVIDVQITATSLRVVRRPVRSRYSIDAEMDYSAEFGGNLKETISRGITEIVVAEQAREIVHDLWTLAGPVVASFSRNVPAGGAYSRTEHFRDLVYALNQASNSIWQATQRVHGNWIVCDASAANLLQTIPRPQFDPAPVDNNTLGVQFIGVLAGKYRVYVDPHLQNEDGASAFGNMLMGFKGPNYWDAGYIWAPYQMFQTERVVLDDFIARQGFAYRYAKKVINENLYARIEITGP